MQRILSFTFAFLLLFQGLSTAKEVKSSDVSKYKKRLAVLVKGERVDALYQLIVEISNLDNEKVAVLLPPAGTLVPNFKNYQAAVKGIAKLKNEKAIEALNKILAKKSGDFRAKVLIIEAYGQRKDELSGNAIVERIDKTVSHIKVSAIRAARTRKFKNAIPALIKTVEKHWGARDREFFEAQMALIDMTGLNFESIDDWNKWWEASKDSFDPTKVKKKGSGTSIEIKKAEDSVEFFGKEVFSKNLLFIIDVSGSMRAKDPSDPDNTRLERAKAQLNKAVKRLRRGTKFNIIAYSNTVRSWQKKMQISKKSALKKASDFVKGLQPIGLTHTDDAIEKAFQDIRVDTIILLSDGVPAKQNQQNPQVLIEKILKWVKDNNSSRKIKIDTFGFEGGGAGGLGGFLKKLAEDNGGTYSPIP